MKTYTVARAREEFSDLLNMVADHRERVSITRHGHQIAVIIPVEAYQLLGELEQRIDALLSKMALAELEEGAELIPWDEVKKQSHPDVSRRKEKAPHEIIT